MNLFLGFLFILLDVPITVGSAVIGLLPDFIGYLLIRKALEERDDVWRHGAFALLLVSVVLFAADLVAKGTMGTLIFGGVALAADLVMLLMLRHVTVKDARLWMLLPVLACVHILAVLLSWVPVVGTVCRIADLLVSLCFLAAAYPYWMQKQ